MRNSSHYIEAVPAIVDVVGKFFLYYGLPCNLHELIEDTSYALNEQKFGFRENLILQPSTNMEEEDTADFKQIIPQLSFKYFFASKHNA